MRWPTVPVSITLAGLTINARRRIYHGAPSTSITIPKDRLLRLLELGPERVEVVCSGIYTDDYAYDNAANFQKGEVGPAWLRERYRAYGTHGLTCYLTVDDGVVHFARHQNEHYRLRPREGVVVIEERAEVSAG